MCSWGNDLLIMIIDRGTASVRDQSLFIAWRGWGGGERGLLGWFFGPLPLNDVLLKWSSSWLLINFVILPKVFAIPPPQKKSSSTTGRKKESKRKVQKTMQGEATRGTSALVKLRTSWDCRHLSPSRMDAFILHAFKLVLSKQILVVPLIEFF